MAKKICVSFLALTCSICFCMTYLISLCMWKKYMHLICIVMCEKMADIYTTCMVARPGQWKWRTELRVWSDGHIDSAERKEKSSDRDCWDLNKSSWWIRMFWTCRMTLIGSNVQQWTWMELIIQQRRRPRRSRWNGVKQDTEMGGLVCPKVQTFGTNFICLFFISGERKRSGGRLWKTAVRPVYMCVCRQTGREMHGSDVQRVAVGRSKI